MQNEKEPEKALALILAVIICTGTLPAVATADGTPTLSLSEYERRISLNDNLVVYRTDNGYTFESVLCNGEELVLERDYNVWNSETNIESCFLAGLGVGTHVLTFHYAETTEDTNYDTTLTVTQTKGDISEVRYIPSFSSYYTPTFYYSGDAMTLNPLLYVGSWENDKRDGMLYEGVDYTVSYENNINVSTDDNMAKIIFTGIGEYEGSARTEEFKIKPCEMNTAYADIEVIPNWDWPYLYDGEPKDMTDVKVYSRGRLLTEGVDYEIVYKEWRDMPETVSSRIGSPTETVEIPIEIHGIGNYTSSWAGGSATVDSYGTERYFYIMPHVEETVSGSITLNAGTDNEIDWSWSLDPDGFLTVDGTGDMPEGFPTSYWLGVIDNQAAYARGWKLEHSQMIKRAEITGNVTGICGDAFSGCANLREVTVPESVEFIGAWCFNSCRSLQSVHTPGTNRLPSSLHTVQQRAFGGNVYNLELHWPDNVSTIEVMNTDEYARHFVNPGTTTEETMKSKRYVYMAEGYPDYYVEYGDNYNLGGTFTVYRYKGHGGEVTIPDFLDSLTHYDIFANAATLVTKLTIPGSIKILNGDAFRFLDNCKEIVIEPGEMTTLIQGFLNGHGDTVLTIPDTVTTMPNGDFTYFYASRTLIVGENSAALEWAIENGYYPDDGSGYGKLYRIRRVTQPSVSPITASYTTDTLADLFIAKADGDFTFDSVKNGSAALIPGTDYTVTENLVTVNESYLSSLGAGTHTLTFHYTGTAGDLNDVTPEDPTVTVVITLMASPVLTVKGNEDADVTEKCTVVWKNGGGETLEEPISVLPGTQLNCTVTPGDELEVDGIQYYKVTTENVTLTLENEPVELQLGMQGTVTVTPTVGGSPIPEGYTVKWYTRSGDNYRQIGTGMTSPMTDVGTVLYADVSMSGENAADFDNAEKAPFEVFFGARAENLDVTGKNNVNLNVTGLKRSGGDIAEGDYSVTWYTKDGNGNFVKTYLNGAKLTNLADKIGNEYYYEIAPVDSRNVLNWLEFHGVPASDATKVTVTDAPQFIDVQLETVCLVPLAGTVTNAATVGEGNLVLSITQAPWSGYQCGPSYYSYGYNWSEAELTVIRGSFSAEVYDFETTVKAADRLGNFRETYQTRQNDALTTFSIAMPDAPLPGALKLTVTRIFPANNAVGFAEANLSYGYRNEGCFADMSFTLHNDTKNADISETLYTVTPTEVRFTDTSALAGVVSMGDVLTLTVTLNEDSGAVLTEDSSKLAVSIKYADANNHFALAYKEHGRVYIDADSGSRVYQTYALYDMNGELADSGRFYREDPTRQIPAGEYTLCVWREQAWLNAPTTLAELQDILKINEYQTASVAVTDGEQTKAELGVSPAIAERTLFTQATGFSDETVTASIGEWTLVRLEYEVEPVLVTGYSPAKYAIDVKTTQFSGHTYDQTVLLRHEDSHSYGESAPDKYISLYCDGKIAESEVKIWFYDATHLGTVKGFTLYTDRPSGVIYFYVQSNKGGDYLITAEGAALNENGNNIYSSAMGKTTLAVDASASALNFTSDYLYTAENGANSTNYNGVWLYTVPYQSVKLYMDGVEIASGKANGSGIASFSFAMDKAKIGTADVSAFREKNPDWSLLGEHEICAVTAVDDVETRSATAVMECVSFTPAVLTEMKVTSFSDYESDSFSGATETLMRYSGSSRTAPSLTSYYWSLNDRGTTFSYTFTATVANADDLFALRLFITGQDGAIHSALMEREGSSNNYTATVSGERLLFTNWGVALRSKTPTGMPTAEYNGRNVALFAVGDDVDIVELLGEDTLVTDLEGNDSNIKAEYDRAVAEMEYKIEQDTLEAERSAILDDYAELIDDLAKMINDGEGFMLDGSEESLEELRELFGIRVGVAADVDYESWDDYAAVTLPDGREMRARSDCEKQSDGSWLYTAEAVVLPADSDDPGYSMVQQMRFIEPDVLETQGTALRSSDVPLMVMGSGSNPTFPTFSPKTTTAVESINNRLKSAYQKHSGRSESSRDCMNYSLKMRLLNGGSDGYGQHQKNTKANLTIQGRINDLLELGPEKLGSENYQRLSDIKTQIDDAVNQSQYSDVGHAIAALIDGAEEYSIGKPGKLAKDLIKSYASKKYEEQYGDEIPTSWLAAGSKLARYYFGGKMSKAEEDLYRAVNALEELLDDLGTPPAATCGGSARATHDPQGVIYEAVLSNPVAGATATLYEKTDAGEQEWNAEEYGQINPQETNASGQYQWFVPEGEWQVRVAAPEGYTDNTSADHPAANLDDGSTAGWLPVMPVQLGINIPLFSTASPEVSDAKVYESYAELEFSLYMDTATLTDGVITVMCGDEAVECEIVFPDAEADPADDETLYAKTARIVPKDVSGFDKDKTYTVSVSTEAEAYNGKPLAEAFNSGELEVENDPYVLEADRTSISVNPGSSASVSLTLRLGDEPVEGKTVTAESSDASIASVTATAITGADGKAIFTVNGVDIGSAELSFTVAGIPIGAVVNVKVEKSVPPATPEERENPFTDVKEKDYFYDAVLWAVENGITKGTTATTFSPEKDCTRGQMVTFLWRAAGKPEPKSSDNPFIDVKEGAYYYKAVLWAVESGITKGTSKTKFSPDALVTRAQSVTFLYRAKGEKTEAENPFTDVKEGAYYYEAVLWAYSKGVTKGTSATKFSPDVNVSRGQVVTFLYRAYGEEK